jgi:hypothetical protein
VWYVISLSWKFSLENQRKRLTEQIRKYIRFGYTASEARTEEKKVKKRLTRECRKDYKALFTAVSRIEFDL